METKKRKRLQNWQAVYHLGSTAGVPTDIVYVHNAEFEQLKDGEAFIKANPTPPDRGTGIVREGVQVSLVQVRGPFQTVQETVLKPVPVAAGPPGE